MTPCNRRPRSCENRTISGYTIVVPDFTGACCSAPGFMTASYFRRNFACSWRIIRSCSNCSRTGRTRIGLTNGLQTVDEFVGIKPLTVTYFEVQCPSALQQLTSILARYDAGARVQSRYNGSRDL